MSSTPAPHAVFAALWAVASLFHLGSHGLSDAPAADVALGIASLFVLWRPSSTARLGVLALAQLVGFFAGTPFVSNNTLVAAFVNATLLAAFAGTAARERSFAVSGEALFRAFAPVARIELLVLYLAVAFHKLNADFLAPETSCASVLYGAVARTLGFLPTGRFASVAAIAGTLAIEGGLPFLLFFRRTRHAALLLGASFHASIVLNPWVPAYDFSSLLLALYALFVPVRFFADAATAWRASRVRERALFGAALAGVVFLVWALDRARPRPTESLHGLRAVLLWVWLAYAGTAIALFAWWLRTRRAWCAGERGLFRTPMRWLALFPGLVALNGAAPYLGLRTEQSFAMYSNLHTEGGWTNHLLVPASAQLFGFQRDLVRVLASSDPALDELAQSGRLLPWFELRRRALEDPDASLVYSRGGVRRELARVGDDPELGPPLPWLLAKTLRFRPVVESGPQPCSH